MVILTARCLDPELPVGSMITYQLLMLNHVRLRTQPHIETRMEPRTHEGRHESELRQSARTFISLRLYRGRTPL